MKTNKPGRIRSALLQWLGVPIHLTDEAFWAEFMGTKSKSGVCVNEKTALQLSAVWACVRLISETIATLPLSMYERTATGKRVARNHPLQSVIHDMPNPDSTAAVFWEAVVAAMLLRGTAWVEKLLYNGKVVGLRFLVPTKLAISVNGQGQREFRYTDKDGTQRVIPRDRMWMIPGFSLDGVCGVSVIAYGMQVFGAALAADTAAQSTFDKGLMPTVYFKMDRVVSAEQRKDFRENLNKIRGALNAGDQPLLEAGMETGTIGINPDEAQLLESRGFSVEEICRWFRVPPFMVGHAEKSTSWGTGIEQQMIAFLAFTLGPWLKRIEQSISKDLQTPADRARHYPKYAVEGLLRADSAARAAFYSVMVNNGIMTRDEVRELEDREPMGGNAAVLTVQTALAPLDSLGQSTDADNTRAALRAFLGVPELAATKD